MSIEEWCSWGARASGDVPILAAGPRSCGPRYGEGLCGWRHGCGGEPGQLNDLVAARPRSAYGIRKLLLKTSDDLGASVQSRGRLGPAAREPPAKSSTCTPGRTPARCSRYALCPCAAPLRRGRRWPTSHRPCLQRPLRRHEADHQSDQAQRPGFTNFDNHPPPFVLSCSGRDWQTQPSARIRGRRPRSVACAGNGRCPWSGCVGGSLNHPAFALPPGNKATHGPSASDRHRCGPPWHR